MSLALDRWWCSPGPQIQRSDSVHFPVWCTKDCSESAVLINRNSLFVSVLVLWLEFEVLCSHFPGELFIFSCHLYLLALFARCSGSTCASCRVPRKFGSARPATTPSLISECATTCIARASRSKWCREHCSPLSAHWFLADTSWYCLWSDFFGQLTSFSPPGFGLFRRLEFATPDPCWLAKLPNPSEAHLPCWSTHLYADLCSLTAPGAQILETLASVAGLSCLLCPSDSSEAQLSISQFPPAIAPISYSGSSSYAVIAAGLSPVCFGGHQSTGAGSFGRALLFARRSSTSYRCK